jgi:cold shock protein
MEGALCRGRWSIHRERAVFSCWVCRPHGPSMELGTGASPKGRRRDVGGEMMAEYTAEQITGIEGIVKWFDPRKGFGFLVGPDGQDIFVHFTVIQGEGFRVLKDGSKVNYDAARSDKGWKATRVVRVEPLEVTIPPRRGYSRSPRR